MGERLDSKRFYNSPVTAKPIQWRTGELLVLSYTEFIDYLAEIDSLSSLVSFLSKFKVPDTYMLVPKNEGKTITEKDLPTEFFNHDLMDVNIEDVESVFEFFEKWGVPYHPLRFTAGAITHRLRLSSTGEYSEYHAESLSIFRSVLLSNFGMTAMQERLEEFSPTPSILKTYSITFEEARYSIFALQFAVHNIREGVKFGLHPYKFSHIITPCASNSYTPFYEQLRIPYNAEFGSIGILTDSENSLCSPSIVDLPTSNSLNVLPLNDFSHLSVRGSLTSAICNQILKTMADPTEWRTCKCEGCEVVFKHRYGRGNRRVHNDSVYCSQKCSERQKKRNQRAAAKNRIKH